MTGTDPTAVIIPDRHAAEQTAVRTRLDEIWVAAAARDFDRLESFHLYGDGFTSFKEGGPREDAVGNAQGERAMFSTLEDPAVQMHDLKIQIYGVVAIATFNGHFTAVVQDAPVALDQQATMVFIDVAGDWKIVHEHFSPLRPAG
jgi:ketosteroid isomerase-like protein